MNVCQKPGGVRLDNGDRERYFLSSEVWCHGSSWQCLGPLMQRDLLQLLQGNISRQDVCCCQMQHLSPALGPSEQAPALAHGRCSRAGTGAALQRQGRAAGSQQGERRLTQGLALSADLIDTDLFPHGKVIEISAPWGWC